MAVGAGDGVAVGAGDGVAVGVIVDVGIREGVAVGDAGLGLRDTTAKAVGSEVGAISGVGSAFAPQEPNRLTTTPASVYAIALLIT